MALSAPWTFTPIGLFSSWTLFSCFQVNVKKGHISRNLWSKWGHHQVIPFVCAFYAYECHLFYNHYNHDGNVIVIPFVMRTCQGDLLGRELFALVHLGALHFTTNHFLYCLFPSIVDHIHIIGPLSIVSSTYEHFQIELGAIDIFIEPKKCLAWSSFGLPRDFHTPS